MDETPTIEEINTAILEAKSELTNLQNGIEKSKSDISALLADISTGKTNIASIFTDISNIISDIQAVKTTVQDVVNTVDELKNNPAVKKLIAEAMANQAEENQPRKVKRVTEHKAHVMRFDGQWVVDFADRNYDYTKKEIIDPYVKEKIHAFNKFNAEKREFEAWITLILEDGKRVELPLNRYVQHRTPIHCTIIERRKVDKSYVIGEVEKNKEVGDMMVGTGVMIDQEVEMYIEIITVKTPEGKVLELPDYAIC